MKTVLILGAAGRDFHNFNVFFRQNLDYQVVAFTATQIPDIAGRRYPAVLAGRLYPEGIPIFEEKDLESLIEDYSVDVVVFSYSDISHQNLMHLASRAGAAGADFWLLGPEHSQIASRVPVISVCAVRTGCGKSPVSRLVAAELRKHGRKPVVIRHPMPYGDLAVQAVQRFATLEDLDLQQCTIEEREEYEPHICEGTVVYAGVDYEKILHQAEKEADVILLDGGNNDTPFYKSDLEIVVVDPHRPGHELSYYPGEVNLRRADVLVINKVDTAQQHDIETVRQNIRLNNPRASVCEMACRVAVKDPELVRGKRVLVVEDEENVRVLLNDAFRNEGHDVTEAATGAEALKRLDAGEFDLMICDLGLPELSGLHVARWVKEFRPELPVIIATGFAEMIADEDYKKARIDEVISKPYAVADVLTRANAILAKRAADDRETVLV